MTGPRKILDKEQFEKLCAIQCTEAEIASVLGMSVDTLETRVKDEYGVLFSEVFAEKRQGGTAALRRAQWTTAIDKANPIMQIFLGKNMLGQADKQEIQMTGDIRITLDDDLDDLAE